MLCLFSSEPPTWETFSSTSYWSHWILLMSGACRLSPYIPKLSYHTITPTCIIPALDTNSVGPHVLIVSYNIIPAITLYPKMHNVYTLNTSYFHGKKKFSSSWERWWRAQTHPNDEYIPSLVLYMIVIHSTFHMVGSTSLDDHNHHMRGRQNIWLEQINLGVQIAC